MKMCKTIRISVIFFLLIIGINLNAQIGFRSLTPIADAHCEGGASGDTNYGLDGSIRTKNGAAGSSTYNRKSYIKFDLSNSTTKNVGLVKLRLYSGFIQGSNYTIDIFNTSSVWTENTITWNNSPAFINKITTFPISALNSWSEIDITGAVIGKLGVSPDISFGLYASNMSGSNQIFWNSKDAPSNWPELVFVYKANKPSMFTATVKTPTSTELVWDTTGCNATKYAIDRKISQGTYENLDTISAGAIPKFVDSTMNSTNTYTYRIIAINPRGINSEPVEATIIGTAPMVYISSDCSQPSTVAVFPASSDNAVLRLNILTQNDFSPIKLTSLNLNMLGTTLISDVTSIRVYYTEKDSLFRNPVRFGQTDIQPQNDTICVNGSQELKSGQNYFWITYHVSENPVLDNGIDAQCLSITLDGDKVKVPSTVAPSGSRIISFLPKLTRIGEELITNTSPYAGTNVVSFAQNVISTYKGYQYAAYWNDTKQVAVARKKITDSNWEIVVLNDYTSTNDLGDNHFNVSMGLCFSDGSLHLSYDHHGQNLNYRRSVEGLIENPDKFEWKVANFGSNLEYLNGTTVVTQVTYPRFVTKPNGDLLLELRKGGSGSGDSYLWEYSGTTHSWSSIGRYINGTSDSENAYLHGIQYDYLGRLHAAWCWRQTPAPETNHDLYYAYSEDHGRTWKNTKGVTVGVSNSNPLRLTTPDLKVWTIPVHRSLMNQESMCVDAKGRVHVLNGFIPDSVPDVAVWGTSYPVHFYRDENGVWHRDFMMKEAKSNRDQIVSDAYNNIYLVLNNNIYMATEASQWTDWSVVAQKGSGAFSGDGIVDRERALKENVLSIAAGRPGNQLVEVNFLIDNQKVGTGKGLTTEYFNTTNLSNKILSPTSFVNFDWGQDSPVPGVNRDSFAVRFNGTLETRYAEVYTLYLTSSEKVRCKINGVLVVDGWNNKTANEYKIDLTLLATHKYDIVIEGAYTTNPASIKLEWESVRQSRSIVPISALYSGAESLTNPNALSKIDKESSLAVYPNPTTGTLYLKASDSEMSDAIVEIFNMTGQKMFSKELSVEVGNSPSMPSLNISELPKGIYVLKVTSHLQKAVKRIILE